MPASTPSHLYTGDHGATPPPPPARAAFPFSEALSHMPSHMPGMPAVEGWARGTSSQDSEMPSLSPGSSTVPERKVRAERDGDFSWKPEAGFSRATTVFSSLRGLQRTWTLIDACIFMLCEHVKPGGEGWGARVLSAKKLFKGQLEVWESKQAGMWHAPSLGGWCCLWVRSGLFLSPSPSSTHPPCPVPSSRASRFKICLGNR